MSKTKKSLLKYFMEVDDDGLHLYKVRTSNGGFVSYDVFEGKFPPLKFDKELGPFEYYNVDHKSKFPFSQTEISKRTVNLIGTYLTQLTKGV